MDIKKILDDHKLWRETGGKKGARANIHGANFRSADLRGTNFCYASFRYADFRDADLEGANLEGSYLEGADLEGANLEGANLYGAYLAGANFYGANLYDAKGILQWQAPQGEKRICYSVKHDDCVMHKLGCFWGTTDEAVEAIRNKYGEGSLYEKFLLIKLKHWRVSDGRCI